MIDEQYAGFTQYGFALIMFKIAEEEGQSIYAVIDITDTRGYALFDVSLMFGFAFVVGQPQPELLEWVKGQPTIER